MIDTHCHILPMCDDGPENWDQAVEMAKEAVRQGITDVIATPHHGKANYINWPGKIDMLVVQLNDRLTANGIALTVWPGQEYHLAGRNSLETGTIRPLGVSKYVLLELPSKQTPANWRYALRSVRHAGYAPIIAHPEKHLPFLRHPSRLREWRNEGAYFQLTAPSLLGDYGKEIQQVAFQMATSGWAHLLASDAHDINKRAFKLREAYGILETMIEKSNLNKLYENAENLMKDESIGSMLTVSMPRAKKRIIDFWW
ncbi:hypothetical protein B1A99_03215 [Cohnella sp. CIP 111063]|jgi:protein-tyrosine phosphatase|uniref:tyrosine-protein phosphatase n=1 Tax=unclassified Cohnella TaxID=2636738 RepID=UPI000B8C14EC|nr:MULTISPECIES: CpsB/CapC family capsule biosynthesis tyrosine phosphatase [unclassified Cohnella]OXS61641.1 hypothetical protein B1A99_03215 [Cohnella sp. CIP 111063]PRX74059.1 protein-tyrosine phosphatase [Cohnella sp. SGD-V74]